MKLNRRSVLGAIGLVGVGTGAAFGSGAFTSTTAERAVEVNVFGGLDDDGLAQGLDGDAENDLADEIRNNFVDVLVDTSPDTVFVSNDGSNLNAGELFPSQFDDGFDAYDSFGDLDENYVSLVANDVTIVFGNDDNGLPPNSTVDYENLFAFVPNDGSSFSVEFDIDAFLTSPTGEDVFSGEDFDENDAEIETGSGTESPEDLDITISQQD